MTYDKRSNNGGKQFNWELKKMNRRLQETMEEIEDNLRQNGRRIIYTEIF